MSRSVAFKTPPVSCNYTPLIGALARCREEVERLRRECGDRRSIHHDAHAMIFDVDALAKLLPAGVAERVIPKSVSHATQSTGATRRDDAQDSCGRTTSTNQV